MLWALDVTYNNQKWQILQINQVYLNSEHVSLNVICAGKLLDQVFFLFLIAIIETDLTAYIPGVSQGTTFRSVKVKPVKKCLKAACF